MYSNVVQVAKLPLQMRSMGWPFKAKVLATGRYQFAVSVADPQGNQLLDASGEIDYEGEPGRTIQFPVVMGPALLTTKGAYAVRIALGNGAPVPRRSSCARPGCPRSRSPRRNRTSYAGEAFSARSKGPSEPDGTLESATIRCGSSVLHAGPQESWFRTGSPRK